jgi:hypothetical protein
MVSVRDFAEEAVSQHGHGTFKVLLDLEIMARRVIIVLHIGAVFAAYCLYGAAFYILTPSTFPSLHQAAVRLAICSLSAVGFLLGMMSLAKKGLMLGTGIVLGVSTVAALLIFLLWAGT